MFFKQEYYMVDGRVEGHTDGQKETSVSPQLRW